MPLPLLLLAFVREHWRSPLRTTLLLGSTALGVVWRR